MSAISAAAERRKTIENIYPLTPMQEGLLFHSVLQPHDGLYVPQMVLRLDGPLDAQLLEQVWRDVAGRHAVLRTTFHWEERDTPFQVVHRASDDRSFRTLDWSDADDADVDRRLAGLLETNRRQPFDFKQAPLARLDLVHCGGSRHTLVFCYHHLILDGWSAGRVLSETFERYRARNDGRPPLPVPSRPYADYVGWLKRQDRAKAHLFWETYLSDHPGSTRLLPESKGHEFASREWSSTPALKAALDAFCHANGVTLNTVLQGAIGLLIARNTFEDDVLFGTTVAGRPHDLPGSGDMVGLFINTIPVRVKTDPGARLRHWLGGLQNRQAEASEYGFHPLREIQGQAPALFDCLLILESYPISTGSLTGLPFRLTRADFEEWTHYPLTLYVSGNETLRFTARYAQDALTLEALDRYLAEIGTLLEEFTANPEALMSRWAPRVRAEARPSIEPGHATVTARPVPAHQTGARAAASGSNPASTPTEKMLAAAWADILRIPEPGTEAHFFDLGGHSLLAARVIGRVRRELQLELPVKSLFDRPVLADLATYIDALRAMSAPLDDAASIEI